MEALFLKVANNVVDSGAPCAILLAANAVQAGIIKYLFEKLVVCLQGKKKC